MLDTLKAFFDPKRREPKVPLHSLAIFVRQLATMVEAGIPLHKALDYLGKSADDPGLRRVVNVITEKVDGGSTLSWALRGYPKIFNEVLCALVETGEMTGLLTGVLQKAAVLMEKQLNMQKKLVSTLTYPCVLIGMSGLSLSVFVFFVLPSTVPLFKSLGMTLPWPTQVLLMSRIFIPFFMALFAILFILYKLFKSSVESWLNQHQEVKETVESLPLKFPVVGPLVTKMIVARMLLSMSSMLENGVNLLPAVNRSAATSSNAWVIHRMKLAERMLKDGELLSLSLTKTEIFPRVALYLIAVGEETSGLSDMMGHAANIFEEEVDLELAKFSALIEPAIMGVMGIVVGFIVISSLLPMLKLIQNL